MKSSGTSVARSGPAAQSYRVARAASALAICIAAFAVIRHVAILNSPVLADATLVNMKLNTAAGITFCGFMVLWLTFRPSNKPLPSILIGGALIALLGGLSLAQDVMGISLGIDELLLSDINQSDLDAPGRMAPTTAVCLIVFGLALVLRSRAPLVVSQGLIVIIFAVCTFTVVGYGYGAVNFYRIGIFNPMAFGTAVSFLILGLGFMMLEPRAGLLFLNTERTGRNLSVFAFPAAAAAAFVIGWVVEKGADQVNASRVDGLAMFAASIIVGLGLLTLLGGYQAARAEQREQLRLREMKHRMKNSLAVVNSILRQTVRTTSDPVALADKLDGRIRALSNSFDISDGNLKDGASVRAILTDTLGALMDEKQTIIQLRGDNSVLTGKEATGLSMIVHELTTNAVKYGSLSSSTGGVNVTWSTTRMEDKNEMFLFRWEEHDGPQVAAPDHQGFGGRLIMSSFPKARIDRRFEPAGLVFELHREKRRQPR